MDGYKTFFKALGYEHFMPCFKLTWDILLSTKSNIIHSILKSIEGDLLNSPRTMTEGGRVPLHRQNLFFVHKPRPPPALAALLTYKVFPTLDNVQATSLLAISATPPLLRHHYYHRKSDLRYSPSPSLKLYGLNATLWQPQKS